MSFDSIPPGLLLKLFDRLPFKDRVRLRGVNRLFNEISWRSINTVRSLEFNDDLMAYVSFSETQSFFTLLESCSSNLESIKAIDSSCSKYLLSALTEFIYPKLERLEIVVTNNELTKKLISRNRHLRSIVLRLDREFEWPDDVVFEKLEELVIQSTKERNDNSNINLSPTLRPLIGKIPNLELLKIDRESKSALFILSVQELNQLLASTPCLESLYLLLHHHHDYSVSALFINMCQDLVASLPTWHLPTLTNFLITLNCSIPSSVLQHFSTSSPQLKTFSLAKVTQIDDESLTALSKLKQLQTLCLADLEMNKDKFTKMITLLPSITLLQFNKIATEALEALTQLIDLRAFHVYNMEMTRADIIDVITKVPTLAVLQMRSISDACSHEAFTDFVTSTADLFNRNLEIQPYSMRINGNESELDQMKAVLEEIGKNGGPMVEMDGPYVCKIDYRSLA